MIGLRLPPVMRSLHEATGVSIWIATFALAYLARIASGGSAVARATHSDEPRASPVPVDHVDAGGVPPMKMTMTQRVAVIAARGADW